MRVLRFIVRNWPLKIGAVLLAVILCAAMSATASALTALSTTTMVLAPPSRGR